MAHPVGDKCDFSSPPPRSLSSGGFTSGVASHTAPDVYLWGGGGRNVAADPRGLRCHAPRPVKIVIKKMATERGGLYFMFLAPPLPLENFWINY